MDNCPRFKRILNSNSEVSIKLKVLPRLVAKCLVTLDHNNRTFPPYWNRYGRMRRNESRLPLVFDSATLDCRRARFPLIGQLALALENPDRSGKGPIQIDGSIGGIYEVNDCLVIFDHYRGVSA